MGCGMSVPRERLHYSEQPGDNWDAQYAANRQGVCNATADLGYEVEWQCTRREAKDLVKNPQRFKRPREDGPFLSEGWGSR